MSTNLYFFHKRLISGQRSEDSISQINSYRQKISSLQDALAQKDAEIVGSEEKYRRCIEKAKEVIRSMDPRNGILLI